MRKLKGYLRRITDGAGPPPGSVEVHATVRATDTDLDLEDHDLGVLAIDHLAGSGSATLADDDGMFGWEFELGPGLIDQEVIGSDPQTEIHWRFPDESSQIGAAFHSDIERLGWAAGGDVMVWNAIVGGNDPAVWPGGDPTLTWNLGNGSIESFGTGGDAGTVVIRPFISFLGGVLFSVESGSLRVPSDATGGAAGPANPSGSDRWDLLEQVLNTDAASDSYGKQTIEISPGTAGAGIPTPAAPSATERRRAWMALKMVAGASVYTSAYDLRGWQSGGTGGGGGGGTIVTPPIALTVTAPPPHNPQVISAGQSGVASSINTLLASNQLILPPNASYSGTVTWGALVRLHKAAAEEEQVLHVKISTEGYGVNGLVAGTDYVVNPETNGMPLGLDVDSPNGVKFVTQSITFPIAQIPGFDTSSQLSPTPRTWSRLRFKVAFSATEPPLLPTTEFRISRQSLMINLTPVA
jgi:hypothetical protein